MMIRLGLRTARVLSDDNFLRQPSYSFTMLEKVAQFYRCLPIPGNVLSVIDDASLQMIQNAIGLEWLTSEVKGTVDRARELEKYVVNHYKNLSLESDSQLRNNESLDQNVSDITPINNRNS